MNRDTYLLYIIFIATSAAAFEFVVAMLQRITKRSRNGEKRAGACQLFLDIARILYLLLAVIICEYLFVNRSAGVVSIAVACTTVFVVRTVFKSKSGVVLISILARPIVALLTFVNRLLTFKRRTKGENTTKNTIE